MKRVFPSIRSPGQFSSEVARAEQKLSESYAGFDGVQAGKRGRLVTAQIVLSRIAASNDEWTEFFACLPIAKAYFGDELEKELERLWRQRVAVSVSAEMYPDIEDFEAQRAYEADFWEGFGHGRKEGDKVASEVAAAISAVEAKLVPLLRADVMKLETR